MTDEKKEDVKSVNEQINEMLNIGVPKEPDPEPEPEVKDEKVEDKVEDEKVDEKVDESTEVTETEPEDDTEEEVIDDKAKETEEKVDEPPVDEVESLRKQNEEFRKQINELSGKRIKKVEEEVEFPGLTLEDIDFIGKDVDIEDIIHDPKKFNELLNKVFKTGAETARKSTTEGVLRNIPNLVKRNIEIATALKTEADIFYKTNKDLEPFKKVVQVVYEDILAEKPELKFEDRMKITAIETRKRLGLAETKPDNKDKGDRARPHLPPGSRGGARGDQRSLSKPKTDSLLDEISDMNKNR